MGCAKRPLRRRTDSSTPRFAPSCAGSLIDLRQGSRTERTACGPKFTAIRRAIGPRASDALQQRWSARLHKKKNPGDYPRTNPRMGALVHQPRDDFRRQIAKLVVSVPGSFRAPRAAPAMPPSRPRTHLLRGTIPGPHAVHAVLLLPVSTIMPSATCRPIGSPLGNVRLAFSRFTHSPESLSISSRARASTGGCWYQPRQSAEVPARLSLPVWSRRPRSRRGRRGRLGAFASSPYIQRTASVYPGHDAAIADNISVAPQRLSRDTRSGKD